MPGAQYSVESSSRQLRRALFHSIHQPRLCSGKIGIDIPDKVLETVAVADLRRVKIIRRPTSAPVSDAIPIESRQRSSKVEPPRRHERQRGDRKVLGVREHTHQITARIDDDYAWELGTIERIRVTANEMIRSGIYRCGFTFRNGYEWVNSDLVDLVDLDALDKGLRVVRPASVRPYPFDFHSMSCFTLDPATDPYDRQCGRHTERAVDLAERGYLVRSFEDPAPAWLYVRHQQTYSALVKARLPPIEVSLDHMGRVFGINTEQVRAIQTDVKSIPYATKRPKLHTDKSRLTFVLPEPDDLVESSSKSGQPRSG